MSDINQEAPTLAESFKRIKMVDPSPEGMAAEDVRQGYITASELDGAINDYYLLEIRARNVVIENLNKQVVALRNEIKCLRGEPL
jgi:hypothetical protein